MHHWGKSVLLVSSCGEDSLLMALQRQQLYGMLPAPVHVESLATPWHDDALAQAVAAIAATQSRFDAVYRTSARGVFHPAEQISYLPPARLAEAEAWLNQIVPSHCGDRRLGYNTVIARPERLAELVHECAHHDVNAQLDACVLRSGKNEWVEAGFIAANLVRGQQEGRTLYLLTGKNYHLDVETELFYAPLHNGCRVLASDLRALYLLSANIRYAQANFTRAQLEDVAKLPSPTSILYVHGNGDLSFNACFDTTQESLARAPGFTLRCGERRVSSWCEPREGAQMLEGLPVASNSTNCTRVHLPFGNLHARLGAPQPGEALELAISRTPQPATQLAA